MIILTNSPHILHPRNPSALSRQSARFRRVFVTLHFLTHSSGNLSLWFSQSSTLNPSQSNGCSRIVSNPPSRSTRSHSRVTATAIFSAVQSPHHTTFLRLFSRWTIYRNRFTIPLLPEKRALSATCTSDRRSTAPGASALNSHFNDRVTDF